MILTQPRRFAARTPEPFGVINCDATRSTTPSLLPGLLFRPRPGNLADMKMQSWFPLIAIGAALTACAVAAQAAHYDVFLLAGQSNMDGRGAKKELTGPLAQWAKPQPDVLIGFSAGGLHRTLTTSQGFKPLEPGYSGTPGNKPGSLPTATFGPEVSFGRTLADGLPGKKLLLLKFAEGGTSLEKDWPPGEKGKLFENFIAFVTASLADLKKRGDTYELRGMIWHQGESDAGLPAGKYQELLTAFIGQVRTRLNSEKLPFVIGEVYDNGKRDRVRADQKATAQAVPGVCFVSAEGLKTQDNGTHFDAASQIEFGRRFAAPLLRSAAPGAKRTDT